MGLLHRLVTMLTHSPERDVLQHIQNVQQKQLDIIKSIDDIRKEQHVLARLVENMQARYDDVQR
jgi:hypothetical protein